MQIQKDLAQLTLAELYKFSREQKTTHSPEGGVAAWRRGGVAARNHISGRARGSGNWLDDNRTRFF